MKALVYHGPGEVRLEELERPSPGKGEVLIKVKAALTCGTDLKAYRRGHPLMKAGVIMGHEFSGVVEQVGEGLDHLKPGDRVACTNSAPCLTCEYCRAGRHNLCERLTLEAIGFTRNGAYAEFVLLPERVAKLNAFKLPDEVPFEEAAFLEPLSCVVHGHRLLALGAGESVLILGAGPIGLMHVQLSRLRGAGPIIVADPHQEKLRLALDLGADYAIASGEPGMKDRVAQLTQGRGPSAVIEAVGRVESWEMACELAGRGGRVLLFGGCPRGTKASFDTYRVHYDELALLGSFHYTPHDAEAAFRLIRDRRVRLAPLINYATDFQGLLEYFRAGGRGALKVALKP